MVSYMAHRRHWMYKALAKLEDEGKIVKEAATGAGLLLFA